jgi:1-acyl-sn-glycerol-3-phosphate acyltransferase
VAEATQIEVTRQEDSRGLRLLFSRLRSYLIFDPLVWFYTIVLGSFSLLCSLFDRSGEIQHNVARLWARAIMATLGAKIEIVGMEIVDISKAQVYVVNHLSALDIPVLYASLPFQFRILAKRELFRYPFLGWHLRRSGQISVVLDSPKEAVRSLNKAVAELKKNMPLVIFPEGGRSPDGQLHTFMGGAFYAAIKAQANIVPMALIGTYEMLKMNTWHIKPRPLQLLVEKPIPTAGMTAREVEKLTVRVQEVIGELYYAHCTVPDLREENPAMNEPAK